MYKSRIHLFFFLASWLGLKAYGSPMGAPTVGWGPGSGLPTYSTGYATMYNPGYAYGGASYMPGYTPTSGMLTPSFSYTQQPVASSSSSTPSGPSNPKVELALQVIADWEDRKDRYDNTKDFPKAYKDIQESLKDLSEASSYLPADKSVQKSKVYWLIKFVKLKVMLQELEFVKSAIPTLLQAVRKYRKKDMIINIAPPAGVSASKNGPFIALSRDWMMEKRTDLVNLASEFQTGLINPTQNFWTSAVNSPELEGFVITWKQAQQDLNYLDQQLGCFNDPTQDICQRQAAYTQTPTSIEVSADGKASGGRQSNASRYDPLGGGGDMYGSDDTQLPNDSGDFGY